MRSKHAWYTCLVLSGSWVINNRPSATTHNEQCYSIHYYHIITVYCLATKQHFIPFTKPNTECQPTCVVHLKLCAVRSYAGKHSEPSVVHLWCVWSLLWPLSEKSGQAHLDLQLLIEGIVDPQVNVAAPVTLLLDGRDVGDGPLIHVPHSIRFSVAFHQPQVVEPGIVIMRIRLIRQSSQITVFVLYFRPTTTNILSKKPLFDYTR